MYKPLPNTRLIKKALSLMYLIDYKYIIGLYIMLTIGVY